MIGINSRVKIKDGEFVGMIGRVVGFSDSAVIIELEDHGRECVHISVDILEEQSPADGTQPGASIVVGVGVSGTGK